jgi:hypothetical protein
MASGSQATYVLRNYKLDDGMLTPAEQARMDAYHAGVIGSPAIINLMLRGTAPGPPMTIQEAWEHLTGT